MSRTVSQTINLQADGVFKYITKIDGGGISIHDSQRQNLDYLQLTSNGIDIKQNNITLASFMADGTQIGQKGESHLEMDYHSMQLLDEHDRTYFYVSDLRDSDGDVHNTFSGDGITTTFILSYYIGNSVNPYYFSVKVNDNTVLSSDYDIHTDSTNSTHSVVFQNAPASGSEIEVIYIGADYKFKSYTLGYRMINKSVGKLSVAEGDNVIAMGDTSHAEGKRTTASGTSSHAEGSATTASGQSSHAEGAGANASGLSSHAEGYETTASGQNSHAEGVGTNASGTASHAEGNGTLAKGSASHAQNEGTIASKAYQTAIGKYNIEDTSTSAANRKAFIIGNGTADDARSNAFTVDWNGNVDIAQGAEYRIGNTSLIDIFYPVGSYYETSDTTFNPNTAWGGTWILETEGIVHVSAGSNYAITHAGDNNGAGAKDGGEATVTLNSSQSAVPSHTHGLNNHTHGLNNHTHSLNNHTHSLANHTHGLTNALGVSGGTWSGDSGSAISGSGYKVGHTADSGTAILNLTATGGNNGNTGGNSGNTGGSTANTTGNSGDTTAYELATAASAHENMPPYINVNRWHRTA